MESDQENFGQEKKPYAIPEEILADIDGIREDCEHMEERFRDDTGFGAKLQIGFGMILEKRGIRERYSEFLSRVEPLNLKSYSPAEQAREFEKIKKWFLNTFAVSPRDVTVGELLRNAYIGEAEILEEMGIDTKKNPPFSLTIGLNEEHPMVQEAREKMESPEKKEARAGGEVIEKLIESTPSLKRKMMEFEEGMRPKQERID
ncbi:MAG: hypothetical protein A2934_02400 [Candidatus Sungbacteria bacterium RIFCSPLOWO2_01_FULL_47_10]|uniref:Uncharacterized protein n=1 Tax=Candidatus Sungbacteria bacterium RIFCSPLOWO2_01_FULL_47_10 TaxID=1802276 RepID=A0A1G2L9J5_9BACT|nr:MAG: hypothetical protein A2934_02400 [Candidatus Sungbacteria bacterium RIFCSPLOWO2_01_FULL_47_10]